LDPSDWKLMPSIFAMLQMIWGPLEVDPFAANHNKKLPRFFSFRPDPEAEAVDALAQTWSDMRPYAFPPFILIGRCLSKLTQDWVREMVMIVPFWQNQTWYSNLLSQLIDLPLLLADQREILTNPRGEFHPLVEQSSLSLVACRVSGVTCRTEEFQRSLLRSYQQPGDMGQRKHTHQHGGSGYFGVISRNPIPFHPLSDQW